MVIDQPDLVQKTFDGDAPPAALPASWPAGQEAFLRFENLSKSYQEGDRTRVVLQDADAQFSQGEFTAILGRSGSGKSTLLNLLSGIDRADSGRLWLGGQELSALDDRQRTLFRRRHIGFVFQFFNLIPTLTVWENVTLPLELNGAGAAEIRQRAEPLLEAVGLLDRLTRQAGKNLLMVPHSADAASHADRVLHLREGKLM
jgi:putative ABC transport system ATP-binding protein